MRAPRLAGFVKLVCLTVLAMTLVVGPVTLAHAAPGAQNLVLGSGGHKLQTRSDGTRWVWAYNADGQLGLGDTVFRYAPVKAGIHTDWASLAAGGSAGRGHSLALKDDGTLWAWGYNNFGQLGLGDTASRNVPTQVGSDSDWVSVIAGSTHALAIKADGTLWAWGNNSLGQLGLGDTNHRYTPTQVGTDTDWEQVAGGFYLSYAIKAGGSLWAWGYNADGQLGQGDTTDRTVPTRVGVGTDWDTIKAGEAFGLGVRDDCTLWAWGDNSAGQLGQNDMASRSVPVQVGVDTDWAHVAGGSRHVIAVRTDGTLWGWGSNYAGNLGLGDLNDRLVPTQVGTGSDWSSPAAGVNDSGALKTDGSSWLWGYNLGDELGFGMDAASRIVYPTLLAAPPVIDPIGDKTVEELAENTFTVSATDADLPADTLTYSLDASAPAGAAIDPATGVFSWTPTEAQGPDSYDITITVSDGKGGVDSETITVTVAEVNADPVLDAIGDKTIDELSELTFTASATDTDIPAQTLTYSIFIGAPEGASIDSTTGAFSWTPTEADGPGSYPVTVIVTDGVSSDSETITITVNEVNLAPVLAAIESQAVTLGESVAFTATATDVDLPANALIYSLQAAPSGATIDPVTGAFSWTPSATGSFDVTVRVTDGVESDSQVVTITVEEPPDTTAPVITIDGVTDGATYDAPVTITASALDSVDGTVTPTLTLNGQPFGSGGTVSTPGAYALVAIAEDAAGNSATRSLTFTIVEPAPRPTVIEVAGDDRVATAIAASTLGFPEGSEYVLIATARTFPDALGGSALAGALDAPILLTEPAVLSEAVVGEIERLGATRIVVLGGEGAVSVDAYAQLAGLVDTDSIERIAGATRYETAELIAARTIEELGEGWDGTAFVATGEAFPDALGASPLAAAKGWPVYLVHPNSAMHGALVATMEADGVTHALILGGDGVVPETLETALGTAFGETEVDRLAGANRYTTAVAVATYGVEEAGLAWDRLAIATGEDFPDALAGGALQGRSGSVMLLVHPAALQDGIASVLGANKASIAEVRFLGGTGTVPQAVRDAVFQALQ